MAKHTVTASALIPAPPQNVYQLIADYRNGHPRILPKPYFIALHVEKGGYGEGTIINYQMKVMGACALLPCCHHRAHAGPRAGRNGLKHRRGHDLYGGSALRQLAKLCHDHHNNRGAGRHFRENSGMADRPATPPHLCERIGTIGRSRPRRNRMIGT